ncbi:palmitoyl-protein thioesterase 1 precursor [Delitschia confertaspora ATCC 74209]|uniref:Palmitoyl-protein thioesterase 1 n=1 Tax=Delitschia confertaspora ATCC 74209 TaxID=1513339 RepID=A0A9P4JK11_9PLEO|nr:palmitoyl-protein thioesterase 1 precursor [Delitschia confertaspora ATCC 74209]
MRSLIAFAALTLTASASYLKPTPLPLIIWHGLGDNYAADGLASVGELVNKTNPGTFVYNIRLSEDPGSDRTATFFGNLTEQISQVCNDLSSHPILSTAPAVNALGFSQGGQFLRGYVERCNYPPVKNLVTFGSQHNGIVEFQACGATDWVCKGAMALLKTNTWSHYIQSHLVPAQYYRNTNFTTGEPTPGYLEHSNFLADVNNERMVKNATYKKNLEGLEKFVMYVFGEDTTVIPKESGWFAQTNLTSGEVTHVRNRTIYKEDWIGLKALDDKGALEFKTIKGAAHMELDDEVLEEAFKAYFSPDGDESMDSLTGGQEVPEL